MSLYKAHIYTENFEVLLKSVKKFSLANLSTLTVYYWSHAASVKVRLCLVRFNTEKSKFNSDLIISQNHTLLNKRIVSETHAISSLSSNCSSFCQFYTNLKILKNRPLSSLAYTGKDFSK